jgi:hypothetical protein
VPQSVPVERESLRERERVVAHQVQQHVGSRTPTGVNQVGVPTDTSDYLLSPNALRAAEPLIVAVVEKQPLEGAGHA